jgi:hypothetical protein
MSPFWCGNLCSPWVEATPKDANGALRGDAADSGVSVNRPGDSRTVLRVRIGRLVGMERGVNRGSGGYRRPKDSLTDALNSDRRVGDVLLNVLVGSNFFFMSLS